MGHWSSRIQLLTSGVMPVTGNLPYDWHDTPNIHLCTIKDFLIFCKNNDFEILEQYITDNNQKCDLLTKLMPNLFGQIATFRIK
jgi:methionine biosynthesis protein MetW